MVTATDLQRDIRFNLLYPTEKNLIVFNKYLSCLNLSYEEIYSKQDEYLNFEYFPNAPVLTVQLVDLCYHRLHKKLNYFPEYKKFRNKVDTFFFKNDIDEPTGSIYSIDTLAAVAKEKYPFLQTINKDDIKIKDCSPLTRQKTDGLIFICLLFSNKDCFAYNYRDELLQDLGMSSLCP